MRIRKPKGNAFLNFVGNWFSGEISGDFSVSWKNIFGSALEKYIRGIYFSGALGIAVALSKIRKHHNSDRYAAVSSLSN